jgi:Skp family chaperone for outer membrane proteins
MKKMKYLVAITVSLILLVSVASGAFAASMGFIDVQKVYSDYKEYKKAKDELKKQEDEYAKAEKEAQDKMDKAIADKKTEEELKKLRDELLADLKPKGEAYMAVKKQKMDKINNDIIKASDKVAKKVGIDVVVDKVAIIVGGVDLTDMVISELNK